MKKPVLLNTSLVQLSARPSFLAEFLPYYHFYSSHIFSEIYLRALIKMKGKKIECVINKKKLFQQLQNIPLFPDDTYSVTKLEKETKDNEVHFIDTKDCEIIAHID